MQSTAFDVRSAHCVSSAVTRTVDSKVGSLVSDHWHTAMSVSHRYADAMQSSSGHQDEHQNCHATILFFCAVLWKA